MYTVLRTDTADAGLRKIVLYIAEKFGKAKALERLDEIEEQIMRLSDNPYMGKDPVYPVLKRQGYKVLILRKDLVFYKIHEDRREIVIHVVVDQRQDYLRIIRGL